VEIFKSSHLGGCEFDLSLDDKVCLALRVCELIEDFSIRQDASIDTELDLGASVQFGKLAENGRVGPTVGLTLKMLNDRLNAGARLFVGVSRLKA